MKSVFIIAIVAVAMIGIVIPSVLGEHEFITAPFSYYPEGWEISTDEYGEVYFVISPHYSTTVSFYELDVHGDVGEFVDDKWTLDWMKENERVLCNEREVFGDGKKCSNFNADIGMRDKIYEIDGYRALTIFYTYDIQSLNDPVSYPIVASTTNIYGENYGIQQIISESYMDTYAEHADHIEKIIQSSTTTGALMEPSSEKDIEAAAEEAAAEEAAAEEAAAEEAAAEEAAAKAAAETPRTIRSFDYSLPDASGNIVHKAGRNDAPTETNESVHDKLMLKSQEFSANPTIKPQLKSTVIFSDVQSSEPIKTLNRADVQSSDPIQKKDYTPASNSIGNTGYTPKTSEPIITESKKFSGNLPGKSNIFPYSSTSIKLSELKSYSSGVTDLYKKVKSLPPISDPKNTYNKIYHNKSLDKKPVISIGKTLAIESKYGFNP